MTRLLCVGEESNLLELRCAVLRQAGYQATPAMVSEATGMLHTHRFDLVVVSAWLQSWVTECIVASAGDTPTLVLTSLTPPDNLLRQVKRQLDRMLSSDPCQPIPAREHPVDNAPHPSSATMNRIPAIHGQQPSLQKAGDYEANPRR